MFLGKKTISTYHKGFTLSISKDDSKKKEALLTTRRNLSTNSSNWRLNLWKRQRGQGVLRKVYTTAFTPSKVHHMPQYSQRVHNRIQTSTLRIFVAANFYHQIATLQLSRTESTHFSKPQDARAFKEPSTPHKPSKYEAPINRITWSHTKSWTMI